MGSYTPKQNNLFSKPYWTMSTENAEVTVETTETIDWEQRAKKAEAKIVDMKKSVTPKEESTEEVKTETTGFDEEAFERKYEEKKFFEANPDMLEYKDKLAEYTSKGIWFKEAKILVENSDETIANRKVASQINFTSWDTPSSNHYTMETLAQIWKVNPWKYAEIIADYKKGKVQVT